MNESASFLVLASVSIVSLAAAVVALSFSLARAGRDAHGTIRHAVNALSTPPQDQVGRIAAEARAAAPRHGPSWVPPRPEKTHSPAFEERFPLASDGGRGPE